MAYSCTGVAAPWLSLYKPAKAGGRHEGLCTLTLWLSSTMWAAQVLGGRACCMQLEGPESTTRQTCTVETLQAGAQIAHPTACRGLRNQHNSTSLVKIDGVRSKPETEFYMGKRIAFIYKAKTLKRNSLYRVIWGKVSVAAEREGGSIQACSGHSGPAGFSAGGR